jgi:hypothetical protein
VVAVLLDEVCSHRWQEEVEEERDTEIEERGGYSFDYSQAQVSK